MKKSLIFICILLTALLLCAFNIKAPVDYSDVFYVNDYAGILDTATEDLILSYNSVLEAQTGGQIVVLTVKTLGGTEIEDYAYSVFNGWGIGSAQSNNGLLILIALDEQDYWVMPGAGTERFLTSGRIGTILSTYMEPPFARGDYDSAVRSSFLQFYRAYESNYGFTYDAFQPGGQYYSAGDAPSSRIGSSCASCAGCGLGAAACTLACSSCAGGGGLGFMGLFVLAVIIYGIIKGGRGGGRGSGGGRRTYYGGYSRPANRRYSRPMGGYGRPGGGGARPGGYGRPSGGARPGGGRPGGGGSRGGGAGRH